MIGQASACDCAQNYTAQNYTAQNYTAVCEDATPAFKPIRVVQFLLVGAAFALNVYTISRNTPYERTEEILLTATYTSFLFVTVVDVIAQFSDDPIPDTPMFLFGVAGAVLFLMAAFGIFFVVNRAGIIQVWRVTTSMALSGICSLIYLLDVLLIYLYGY